MPELENQPELRCYPLYFHEKQRIEPIPKLGYQSTEIGKRCPSTGNNLTLFKEESTKTWIGFSVWHNYFVVVVRGVMTSQSKITHAQVGGKQNCCNHIFKSSQRDTATVTGLLPRKKEKEREKKKPTSVFVFALCSLCSSPEVFHFSWLLRS